MEPATTGYSGTPLPKKLGLADGQRVLFVGLPEDLEGLASCRQFLAADRRDGLSGFVAVSHRYDLIHAFTLSHAQLAGAMVALEASIVPDGTIWISWPKKASKIKTDVTEDVVRDEALKCDLVDVKVCAVDAVWSGLKLVIRKDRRNLH
ncbi:DUF3052 family protein [Pelagibacterium lentulum]|uniref:DUF3052 domain-containing protein n=1 Tax=Pelagibacterium lentulum TaxID=2029865 RepID=A0A916R5Q2_9HYPH|nr:DUF3052 family protein [Pelagibacterium lentulum]GGA35937.1 hypothetical protein GCM10011499_01600 [Pelagibacterium lentulum]